MQPGLVGTEDRSCSLMPFNFYIGEQPNITTHKSVITAEHPERANLPFTHSLEYTVRNQLKK